VEYFDRGGVLQISDIASTDACWKGLNSVPGLHDALVEADLVRDGDVAANVAAAELLLEGLAAHRRISRADTGAYARVKPERQKKGGGQGFPFDMT